jgi:DedD protein
MEQGLKQRLVGAAVLAALAVIFLPMIYDEPVVSSREPRIPARPGDLTGPQFAPLTEAEVTRDRHLPDAPITTPSPAEAEPADAPIVSPPPTPGPTSKPTATAAIRAPPAVTAAPAKRPTDPPSKPGPARTPPANERVGVKGWAIQLGSFSSEANAKALRDRLRKLGFQAFVERIDIRAASVFRVRVGPETERQTAEALRAQIEKKVSLSGILVRYP